MLDSSMLEEFIAELQLQDTVQVTRNGDLLSLPDEFLFPTILVNDRTSQTRTFRFQALAELERSLTQDAKASSDKDDKSRKAAAKRPAAK